MNAAAPRLVVSVHDVSPATASETSQWVHDLDQRAIPSSLLVVPGPWRGRSLAGDPRFARWLRARADAGHEICLHGWNHTASRGAPGRNLIGNVVARGCAEFWFLDEEQAAERARRGLEVLDGLGLEASGFTPPGWLLSGSALKGLRRAGLDYVTTHTSVTDLRTGVRTRALAFCHRPNATGERIGAALMVLAPRLVLGSGRTLRIALHPDDLSCPGLREVALRAIDAALDGGAVAHTYRTLIDAPDDRSAPNRPGAETGRPDQELIGHSGRAR